MKKTMSAYMSVEAVWIVTFAMFVSIVVIYIGFYQYDRCLMRQDAYRTALFGSSLCGVDSNEVYNAVFTKANRETEDKYIGTEGAFTVTVRNHVTVTIEGCVNIPFPGLAFLTGGTGWSIEETGKSKRINPIFFIRSCRQILPESREEE